MGGSLEWHLTRAGELTNEFAENPIGDIVIETKNKTICPSSTGDCYAVARSEGYPMIQSPPTTFADLAEAKANY